MSNKALIIGDAAHAMVPFFAQGMNSVGSFFVVLHYSNTPVGGGLGGGALPYEKVVDARRLPERYKSRRILVSRRVFMTKRHYF